MIPVFSWLSLRGYCRYCHNPISALYPAIELFTAVLLSLLYLVTPSLFFIPYFIFCSALIVTIRSDLETMLISRFVTIFLIPLGLLFSALGLISVSLLDSILGALLGYCFLLATAELFHWLTKKQGIGQGDLELLAFIGSFTGVAGCWISLTIGSILGSLIGLSYLIITRQTNTSIKIPFGPFLAVGALFYVLLQESIIASLAHL